MPNRKKIHTHTRLRGTERFSLNLTKRNLASIIQRIREARKNVAFGRPCDKSVRKLKELTNTRTLYAVLYEGTWLPIIYSNSRRGIITILPEEELNNYSLEPAQSDGGTTAR